MPALAVFGLYALVNVEYRFLAAQFAVLYMVAYSGVSVIRNYLPRLITSIVGVSMIGFLLLYQIHFGLYDGMKPMSYDAAVALQEQGVEAGDRIGLIWDEKWDAGAGGGAFVPRLLRAQVVA